MKSATITAVLAALVNNAAAFPSAMLEGLATSGQLDVRPDFRPLEKRVDGTSPGFDAKAQYVSNKGKYKYVAPGPHDLRGPCPGLNALANHNYLPHNGVATIQQFIDATYRGFGMGLDLGGFLAVYGAVFNGDLVSWSIGGPQKVSLVSPLAGLVGQPQGISGSHNNYECDVSPTRGDLWTTGEAYDAKVNLFKGIYAYQAHLTDEESNYDLGALQSWRVKRFQHSVNTNPYFFNGIFSGFQVQPAAYTFMFRFMGNKSADYPEGRLNQKSLKAFFGMRGEYPNFKYEHGTEYIPDNWYKRAIGDEYTIPFFEQDLIGMALQNPEFLNIGGNTGKVNTFTGLDLRNLTGGVYDLKTLTEGHNALCFSFQLLGMQAPDIIQGKFLNAVKPLAILDKALGQIDDGLGCPKLNKIEKHQFDKAYERFPGYKKLNRKGEYPNSRGRL